MPRPNEALLNEHLAAENDGDLDRIMATYGESPVILLNGQRIEGHAAIREFHRAFGFGGGGSFAGLRVDERARHVSDDAVAIEQTVSGRHQGAWLRHEATGRSFAVHVCTIYKFDERGLLTAEHVYLDRAEIERQLTR
jgi:hypothetical protein